MTGGLQPSSTLQPYTRLQPSTYITAQGLSDSIELLDGQYEIGGLVFGTRDPRQNQNAYLVESFDITPGTLITGVGGNLSSGTNASGSNNTADASYPNEDGLKFGQDYYTGMIIVIALNVWLRGRNVYDFVGALKGVWRDQAYRYTPNLVTTLRMCRNGRTRLVYGRPRDFKETYGEGERGWAPITMQFQCANEVFYDDDVNIHNIGIQNPPVDGLTFPATVPFRLAQYQEQQTTIHNTGDFPTWPTFEIFGPCINPTIQYDDKWTIELLTALDHTQSIVIDPRPWRRLTLQVSQSSTTNIAGVYTQDSPTMKQMQIETGQHSIIFSAVDPTLTSYVQVSWRNAYATP